jgi:adenylate cyclase class 2
MSHEKEAKIRVDDFAAVRKALKAAGARLVSVMLETDTYFDRPDGSLRKADCGLRIRTLRPLRGAATGADGRPIVTYKGPRAAGAKYKVRRETQTRVDDAEAMAGVFGALGLGPTLVIQKRREIHRLGRSEICLDELPRLGRFVEVEAPTEATISRILRRLGLRGEHLRDSYTHLAAKCLKGVKGRKSKTPSLTFVGSWPSFIL